MSRRTISQVPPNGEPSVTSANRVNGRGLFGSRTRFFQCQNISPPHAMGQHHTLFSLQISLSEALEVIRHLAEVPSPVIRESLGLLPSQSFTEIIKALAVDVLFFPYVMQEPVSNLKRLEHGDLVHSRS